MKKVIQLIGEFIDGSEFFGEVETEEEAIKKAEHWYEVYGDELSHIRLETIIKK